MINTEPNGRGVGSGGTAAPAHDKQLAGALKGTAQRDVKNEKLRSIHKLESFSPERGRSNGDTVKLCGTKRLAPECPSTSQGLPPSAFSTTNENVVNARRRFELELGRRGLQNNVVRSSEYAGPMHIVGQLRQEVAQKISQMKDNNLQPVPVTTSNNLTATVFSNGDPLVQSSLYKYSNGAAVVKVGSVPPGTVGSKSSKDQLRTECFIRLQKFLKQCDEADPREYSQMLVSFSSAQLSKYAVELEKRAIQLAIDEGNEMQRRKALNILSNSSSANHSSQSPP